MDFKVYLCNNLINQTRPEATIAAERYGKRYNVMVLLYINEEFGSFLF